MKGSLVSTILALLLATAAARAGQVVINEIHYEPPDKTKLEEFVEIYNAGATSVDLSLWYFSDGIFFTFPAATVLGAGQYAVVAENPANLAKKFPEVQAFGPFEGHLSNDGDKLVLRNAQGAKEDEVNYQVRFPWPIGSAGDGGSMELLHPLLDNDLGGSWRNSTGPAVLPEARTFFIQAGDGAWGLRKGLSEASDPPLAWRDAAFIEDGTWTAAKAPFGYGKYTGLGTLLDDMKGTYSTVYLRHWFTLPEGAPIPLYLKLRLFIDDGCIAAINGKEIARAHVSASNKPFNGTGTAHEAKWEEILIKDPGSFLQAGANLLAVHALNVSLANDDFVFDAELCVPARSEFPSIPTPGAVNSVFTEAIPPQIRQVETDPVQPPSGVPFLVTAKVTDPEGIASVTLKYQVVLPGQYIPSHLALEPSILMATPALARQPNPAFENPANWTEVAMTDDGKGGDDKAADGIWTAVLPAQVNRTLVRWRITAADLTGSSVQVPYPDDPSLNFAAFVYDGVPPYAATKISVHPEGKGHVYPQSVLESLPVYILITRNEELLRCLAYNGAWQIPKSNEAARDAFNWEGAFVFDGVVHDHVHYRLRQANDRYNGPGKRSWRIRFNKGRYLQTRDNLGRSYPTMWRTLNTGKMFDNLNVGNFGLTETLNSQLWNLVGVPAPDMHTFHLRVIDGPDEVPAGTNGQYLGDFWGMALASEDYDPRFIEAHGMADGNLYKLKDGIFDGNQLKRNQGRFSVTTDADFQNIRASLRPTQTAAWLDKTVRYEKWYPYHTVVEGIRHYDFVPADSHSKNRAWFFEPFEGNPLGRLWTLPYDSDASWGPNWNSGIDYSTQAIASGTDKAPFRVEYRNFIREFRDLLWREDALNPMIDDLARVIAEFSKADRDRWRSAPAEAGSQDYGTMEAKAKDMKNFAFVGWSGGSGPAVGAGGRAKYLDTLASAESDTTKIPRTPVVTAAGPAHFPIDNLVFEVSPFSDPQGDGTFGALKWRVGEITDPKSPLYNPFAPRMLEWTALWESPELTPFESRVAIPLGELLPGRTYRVRARMMDDTGRWSHWSEPVEFIPSKADGPIPSLDSLRVTEVMYNPAGGGDLEFIEIQNIGAATVDLTEVRISAGISFSFEGSAVTALGPGEFALVVKSLDLFSAAHDTSRMKVAGQYGGRLDNGGESIALQYGDDLTIQEFTYLASWYPETDGGGFSLVAADPLGPLEAWSMKEGWRPSIAPGGSPGEPDGPPLPRGRQIPGDLSQDGRFSLGDTIGLLRLFLFGADVRLPCEGALDGLGGNRSLLDGNGDGQVDISDALHGLSYLFLSGPPPALGAQCIPIVRCPDAGACPH